MHEFLWGFVALFPVRTWPEPVCVVGGKEPVVNRSTFLFFFLIKSRYIKKKKYLQGETII